MERLNLLRGHKIYKLWGNWLFDITELKIYKMETNRFGRIIGLKLACQITLNGDKKVNDTYMPITVGTIREAYRCIDDTLALREGI